MQTKLTLKLDAVSIGRAKRYARKRKGTSLSNMVENYFNSLSAEPAPRKGRTPPIVAGLAGAAKRSRTVDGKKDYAAYLAEKYK
jgi:hypothetical protein